MSTTELVPDGEGASGGGGRAGTEPVTAQAGATTATASGQAYLDIQRSPEFVELRRRFRNFVFPLAGLFLVWYFLYVLLAAYASGFMGTKVFGNVNIGLLFGLGQFVSTFAITMFYARWADRTFDPAAEALRTRFEAGAVGSVVPEPTPGADPTPDVIPAPAADVAPGTAGSAGTAVPPGTAVSPGTAPDPAADPAGTTDPAAAEQVREADQPKGERA